MMDVVAAGFCLVGLWVNTLLMVSWVWGRGASTPARAGRLVRGSVALFGVVRSGSGPEEALAVHGVAQRGRRLDGTPPRVAWHDQGATWEVFGGELEVDGERVTLLPEGEVWPNLREQRSARPLAPSEAILAAASRPRGFVRTVSTALRPGAGVHVEGQLERREGRWVLRPSLISAEDPRRIRSQAKRGRACFGAAALAGSAGITCLTCTEPLFGPSSTVGAVLGLLFFLLVQPIGVWVRDQTDPPAIRKLEGLWEPGDGGSSD